MTVTDLLSALKWSVDIMSTGDLNSGFVDIQPHSKNKITSQPSVKHSINRTILQCSQIEGLK